MPARTLDARGLAGWTARGLVVTFILSLLVTAAPAAATKARGVDLTGIINAARSSQLASEASMVAADRKLRSLKKDMRRNRRKIRKASRNLEGVLERRQIARDSVDALKRQLESAKTNAARLAAEADALGWPPKLLGWPPKPPALPLPPTVDITPPMLIEIHDQRAAAVAGGLVAGASLVAATPEEIEALKNTRKQKTRRLRKVERATRRTQQARRAKVRKRAVLKRQRRAALSQRASSEAALKSGILSMSRLALRRATKKTRVRPGRNTPFVWPARGRISQGYGCTGSSFSPARGGCSHFHDGIDIVAGHASLIRAAGVGVVSYIGRNPWDRGKRAFMVVIAHPGGYETLYAHVLPIRKVKVGQLVRKGQALALMGSTGHSTGTHLHLELRRGRTTLNPLAFL